MTKKLWSINALSVELGMDRRTIASRLRNTPARGKHKGHDVWYLSDALAVCAPNKRQTNDSNRPEGLEALRQYERDDVTAGMAMGLTTACAVGPSLAAIAAVHMGAPLKAAYALSNLFQVLLMNESDKALQSAVPGTEFTIDLRMIQEVNWEALAKTAGEKVDVEAWKAYQAEMVAAMEGNGAT